MNYYKFLSILALIIILFFSISCSMITEAWVYDIPTPKIYRYVDKAICIYPVSKLDPSVEESLLHKPAFMYFSPQFKSVDFASDLEEAKNVEADVYIQISIGISHIRAVHGIAGSTEAELQVRCYDSNWKLILISKWIGTGKTSRGLGPKQEEEALYKAMNGLAKRLANAL